MTSDIAKALTLVAEACEDARTHGGQWLDAETLIHKLRESARSAGAAYEEVIQRWGCNAVPGALCPPNAGGDCTFPLCRCVKTPETAPGPAVPERKQHFPAILRCPGGRTLANLEQGARCPGCQASVGEACKKPERAGAGGAIREDARSQESAAPDRGPVNTSPAFVAPSAPQGELRAFVSVCCGGERCYCGKPAAHKVEETIFDDDPTGWHTIGGRRFPARHPFTKYICAEHFDQIMHGRTPPLGGTAGATVVGDNWLNDVSGLLAGMGTPRSHDLLKQLAAFTALKNGAAPPAQSVEHPLGKLRDLFNEIAARTYSADRQFHLKSADKTAAVYDFANEGRKLIDRLTSRPAVLGGALENACQFFTGPQFDLSDKLTDNEPVQFWVTAGHIRNIREALTSVVASRAIPAAVLGGEDALKAALRLIRDNARTQGEAWCAKHAAKALGGPSE